MNTATFVERWSGRKWTSTGLRSCGYEPSPTRARKPISTAGTASFSASDYASEPTGAPARSSTPLLLGTAPARRGSTSTARRRARAKALKQASTM